MPGLRIPLTIAMMLLTCAPIGSLPGSFTLKFSYCTALPVSLDPFPI